MAHVHIERGCCHPAKVTFERFSEGDNYTRAFKEAEIITLGKKTLKELIQGGVASA